MFSSSRVVLEPIELADTGETTMTRRDLQVFTVLAIVDAIAVSWMLVSLANCF